MNIAPTTNYSADLGDREPLAAMRDTLDRLVAAPRGWTAADFERRYAPGRWTARQLLVHLAQTELALGVRARMALSTPDYAAQPFDQDAWLEREPGLSGADATTALAALGRMNIAFFEALSPADRAVAMSHPEYGTITVDWIIYTLAGHQIHHLHHLEQVEPTRQDATGRKPQ